VGHAVEGGFDDGFVFVAQRRVVGVIFGQGSIGFHGEGFEGEVFSKQFDSFVPIFGDSDRCILEAVGVNRLNGLECPPR